jgi:hypothetical protein
VSNNYILNWASGAGQRWANWITDAEHEGRLPCGIVREFGQLSQGSRFLISQPLMIDEFHGFIDRPARDSPAGQQQMRPLPYPPRAKALFLVITIPHGDKAENGSGPK